MELSLPPVLPGLVVRRRLGAGPLAPWLARADDGTWLVVRPGARPPGLPEHPCLLPVLGSVAEPSGRTWVLLPYRSGSGLDRRLARLGRADPRLARAVGLAVARALAALHEDGLAHTDLSTQRVLLGDGDQPVLDASCARAGTEADRLADLQALADLIEAVCPAEGSLARVVAAARAGADTQGLVTLLLQPARPSRGADGRHARHAGAGRAVVGATATLVLLAGAGLLGVQLAARPQATGSLGEPLSVTATDSSSPASPASSESQRPTLPPSMAEPTSPSPPDWSSVLAELDRARAAAFAAADVTMLDAADAPGSEALRRDRVLLRALGDAGVVAEGLATRIERAVPRALGRRTVVLTVADRLSAYVLRDLAGHVVERRPARGPSRWSVHLVLTDDGWRVSQVEREL